MKTKGARNPCARSPLSPKVAKRKPRSVVPASRKWLVESSSGGCGLWGRRVRHAQRLRAASQRQRRDKCCRPAVVVVSRSAPVLLLCFIRTQLAVSWMDLAGAMMAWCMYPYFPSQSKYSSSRCWQSLIPPLRVSAVMLCAACIFFLTGRSKFILPCRT